MEVQFGPNSVDEPNLLYKLQRKIKVFNTQDALPNRGYNLVASSSKYGIVFVASPDGSLSVYQLPQLVNTEVEPQHVTVKLQEKPTHIAVSCDQELLAVTGGQLLNIYKITDFQNQNVSPSVSIKCDANPSTFVSAMQWNPCIPDSIVIVFYDGMLLACQASTSQTKKVPSKGRCLCWSPKGKQFVTGNSDGTLTQYKPDLTPAKSVPPPKLFEGSPVEALAVYWISTFQFAVVYKNAIDNSRPVVTIINTPKAGQPSCLNYEDICYSMGANRPWFYYLQGIAPWNIILSSSSNSMEIGTLGSADGANWVQWSQTDEARPELPLTDKKQENYPVGICIDTSAVHQLPWGENEILPFMPTLLVVSQTGLLTLFNVINMNKQAGQVCSPPQLLSLPANALRTDIPGELPVQPQPVAPSPVAPPVAPVIPKPIPIPQQYQAPPQPQAQAPPSHVGKFGAPAYPVPGGFTQARAFGSSTAPQMVEQKQPVDVKPTPPAQPAVAAQLPKQPAHVSTAAPPTTQSQEAYAAAKAEQDRLKALKAQQELKNMLVKEVNDFQMELYKFTMKTREAQVKIMQDIDAINLNFNMQGLDAEQLKKDCSLEDLRGAVVQLKLELVRACAVVAEARTHAEANDIHQWSQADPLTTKRLATVKKLAYYVQNQVDQAYRALDHKWNENASRDSGTFKPGQRMIRPVLDDVYQPLVKQQEILCRQEAVLRTLKSTLKEVDAGPMFKSSSLLRSTPFRNKDPLSKLTKNILNMSIEPQSKPKELLSAQKLDALRDMLSNHNTVKVKPVSVDLRQQLSAMRLRYEKSVEDKAALAKEKQEIDARARVEAVNKVAVAPTVLRQVPDVVKVEPKPEIVSPAPLSVPTYTPFGSNAVKPTVPGLTNVARTLFADEPKTEPAKPAEVLAKTAAPAPSVPIAKPPAFAPQPPAPAQAPADNHRSVLKDLLQKKQANATAIPKSDANTFMGQKICSPTAFSFGTPNTETKDQPAQSKPPIRVLDTKNMFSNFQPQAFSTAPQPPAQKSSETGEPDPGNTVDSKKEDKPISSIFGTSTLSKDQKPLTNLFGTKSANIAKETPVQKPQDTPKVENKAPVKVILKAAEKSKENVPEKVAEAVTLEPQKPAVQKKEPEAKPLNTQSFNFGSGLSVQPVVSNANVPASQTVESPKPVEVKTEIKPEEPKVEEKADSTAPGTESSSASSLFAAANASSPTAAKPQPVFGSTPATTQSSTPPVTPSSSTTSTDTTEKPSIFSSAAASSASSIFSTAVASQASKTTQSGSIFNTATTSVFSSTSGSLFGTSTTPTTTSSVFGTPTSPSVFSGEAKPVFNTTQTTAQSVFASSPSVFAQATTAQSVFSSSTTGSIFGTASTQASTTSVFGSPATQASVFGTPTTTAASLFGSPPSTQASVFGSPATTAQSVFGTATATTQAASVFGSANQSVFGSTTPSTQASIFGSPSTQASVFGTATPSTQASVFGSPTSTTQSVFGSTPATTTRSGSLFGGAEANLFAAASISATSAPSQSSGGSIFGSSSPGSVFGGGTTNVFGGKSTFNQSNPTAAAIFGGGGASAFGQQKQPQANNFWSGGTGNAGSPGFGSGFGQQAQATQASSIFGGATGGSFSTPSPAGQAFGSPQQAPAFGTADNKPSVFGSPQQQTSPAFGGSPVFASKPVFGQPSGFGSPTSGGFGSFGGFNKSPSSGFGGPAAFGSGASFGGAPAFGNTSPGKVFGGAPQGFGSPTQSGATFESLATQNTLTFGNLAQQSGQQPQQAAPSFNTSPAFTGWRG